MAALLAEADDAAYAADGEGPGFRRLRPGMKKREFGLHASRLRQRPPTKQEPASDVPREPPLRSHNHGHRSPEPHSVLDDGAPQLPPLPISPRWASLPSTSSITTAHILLDRAAPPAAAATGTVAAAVAAAAVVASAQAVPQHPQHQQHQQQQHQHHHQQQHYHHQQRQPSSRATTSSSSSSRFAGLSSHPYAADPPPTPDRPAPLSRESPAPDAGHDGPAVAATSRPQSRDTAGSSMLVENFSRPQRPAFRQSPLDSAATRLRQPEPVQLEQLVPHSAWPRDRARGLSLSSSRSASTHASVSNRPSNDHLRGGRRVPSGGMGSPGLPKPQMAYSRIDSGGGNVFGLHSGARDNPPWIADDEGRSSYRSQLTTSTLQGTLFSSTERSSVLTKTSSRTSASLVLGASVAPDEGLSVDDIMGMYEKGFYSTGAEDNDLDNHDDDDDGHGGDDTGDAAETSQAPSRPETSRSGASRLGSRILEAMSDPLPVPSMGSLPIPGDGPHVVRDSGAFFRNSGLPSSLPKDARLGLASEGMRPRKAAELSKLAPPRKRDSAKMLENHDGATPRRQPSTSGSARSVGSSASRSQPPTVSLAPSTGGQTSSDSSSPSLSPAPVSPVSAAVEEEDPASRDRYGFRKHNQYISREQYDEWNGTYSEYTERRRRKWVAYLKDVGLAAEEPTRFPPPGPKTKRFIRKGIPPEWRGAAWWHYAQGPSILAKHPGEYDALVQRADRGEAKEIDSEAIERDLHRTFPDNLRFQFPGGQPGGADASPRPDEPKLVSSLRRVLRAFSMYNPRIGYCQSLNFLAGLLLLFVETEEQCFWLLNVITRLYLPGTHETSLEGSKVDLGVLMAALQDSMPAVWAKVGGELDDLPVPAAAPPAPRHATLGRKSRRPKLTAAAALDRLPPITLCMTAWFMSCFIGTLPIETTLRVWDVFFYEGSKTLFRVALGIFKLGEAEIRAVADPMEMFGVVQAIPRRLLDCNGLMEATFRRRNGFGHISQETIEERRRERRDAMQDARRAAAGDGGADDDDAAAGMVSPIAGDLAGSLDLPPDPLLLLRRKGTLFGRRRDPPAPHRRGDVGMCFVPLLVMMEGNKHWEVILLHCLGVWWPTRGDWNVRPIMSCVFFPCLFPHPHALLRQRSSSFSDLLCLINLAGGRPPSHASLALFLLFLSFFPPKFFMSDA